MSVKKDIATIEGHLEPLNHDADAIKFDPTGTGLTSDNVQDAIVEAASGSSGDVSGPSSSTDNAIARFDGTTGKLIKNSPGTLVQDSGAIQAQALIENRQITGTVNVPTNYTWIADSIEQQPGSVIVMNPGSKIVII